MPPLYFFLCRFGLFFFSQVERALAEMRRVMRPGGRLAVSMWDRSMDEQWAWIYLEVQGHLRPGPAARPVPSRLPSGELDNQAGLERGLSAAGFRDIRVSVETHDFVYFNINDWWETLGTFWPRMALERIEQVNGAQGLALFKRDFFDRLQAMRRADGVHQYFLALLGLADK